MWKPLIVIFLICNSVFTLPPNYQACLTPLSKTFPYCNASLTIEDRLNNLVSLLTLDEKIGLIAADPTYDTCPIVTKPVDRIGLPRYMWLVETNTGVSSACMGPNKCATTFIGPGGLGASFNRSLWFSKGDVISSELRAFSNANWYRGIASTPYGFYLIGLDGFGPNMNIVRDPRFGRNSELPGEDPYLTGSYATAYVKGIQQADSKGYIKMHAYLKHFDAYSVENNRGHDNYVISAYDFADTYLPAYQMAFTQGRAGGVMCSYNAENGHPSCANNWLLNQVIREQWNTPDALVTSDCGAISNLLGPPANAPSGEYAAAWAINNGTDIEAGSNIFTNYLHSAIDKGLTTEAAVDASLRRALLPLFRAGRFDPVDQVSWTKITTETINSTYHQKVNFEAALQSFVLLKNNGVLPLPTGKRVAVVGPQGVARFGLLSDYYGDMVCYVPNERPDNKSWDCIQTIGEAITNVNIGGVTQIQMGVDINSQRTNGIADALQAAMTSDYIVLVLGIDNTIEHEGIDRKTITLPGLQESFAQQVLNIGKPTILILVNGGVVAIDNLIQRPQAIVEAFYPSVKGAEALAATLFGRENRWGKLPVTIYPADYINQVEMTNYNMSKPPGRTYRYYTGTPLFPFGAGLSYTTFDLQCNNPQFLYYQCMLTNTGNYDGDEVIQVYHSAGDVIRRSVDHPVPLKSLINFERVTVSKGKILDVDFKLRIEDVYLTNNQGDKVLYNGIHYIIFSRGNGKDVTFPINIQ